jgi:hypothetical protein
MISIIALNKDKDKFIKYQTNLVFVLIYFIALTFVVRHGLYPQFQLFEYKWSTWICYPVSQEELYTSTPS